MGFQTWLVGMATFVVLIGVSTDMYNNRDAAATYILEHRPPTRPSRLRLSDDSKTEIMEMVLADDSINGASVMTVDLPKNRKYVVYAHFEDQYVNNQLTEITRPRYGLPVFTPEHSNINDSMTTVLNGGFVCYLRDTTAELQRPAGYIEDLFTSGCSIGIPPLPGQYEGILTMHTKHPPSEPERIVISYKMKRLALDIFQRDVH